jgi:phosphoglycolate phosphatase
LSRNLLTVFLDLDGTLTDPKPGITRSIRHALLALGREAPDEDALTWCIGPPLLQSFAKLLGDEAEAERALALYRERFSDVGLYENRVYDGVPEMLTRLRDAGFKLNLATSKPHVFASRITAHFGLEPLLERVFGSELDGTRSGKTALLAHALERTDAEPGQAAMLGDREHDIIGARNNGIVAVGALWGFGSKAELQAAGATGLAESPKDAANLITSL